MPVLAKNTRIDSFKKGSRVGAASLPGWNAVQAVHDAFDAFYTEFEAAPNLERTSVIVFFSTFQTHAEVIEQPEET